MLALCHVLDAEGLADRDFLDRYTVGYPRFIGYVRGESDGVPKTPALLWSRSAALWRQCDIRGDCTRGETRMSEQGFEAVT